ncbi:MAG: phosphoglycolate phosphatase [Paracoccus sp. (in: a-proteobacteria)]|uniref:phosphoglycolate phosphatase n=1 Tax=Paracoccus sp. TaxID=267 RepID=UPI0026DF6926|nr:phosphoglycolate phosphatase [Paracoccus sp. (in: a-proteobacteria)]MDO5621387.1 phosphoglycolate phosphatase [Paracoccus sp. (in: a-proteobacteria)]
MRPVIFDLDGTLIDSAPDIHASVNAVLRDKGHAALSLDHVRSFIGGGVDLLWQQVLHHLDLPQGQRPDYVAPFMARYQRSHTLTRLYPNALEMLGVLADLGHPLGLCTNKPTVPARAVLDHFGMAHLFGAVICGDTLPSRKPAPEMPLETAARLGGGPAIFVGDSEIDAQAAEAAGMPLLLFMQGYRKTPIAELPHHASFDDYAALPGLVADMG